MEKVFTEKLQNMKYDTDIGLQQTIKKFMDEKVELTKVNALLEQELSLNKKSAEKQIDEIKFNLSREMESQKRAIVTQYDQNISRIKDQK